MSELTTQDVVETLHVLSVVIAFGGAMVYPVWFWMIRRAGPAERAFFHRVQASLGKFVITPAMLVLFGTGAWLASDIDVWDEEWVIVPTVITVVILALGAGVLGPSEERLARRTGTDQRAEYRRVFRRVEIITWVLLVLVVAATFMMVARIPR